MTDPQPPELLAPPDEGGVSGCSGLFFRGEESVFALPGTAAAQVVTENGGVISPVTPILRESVSYLEAESLEELRWGNQLILSIDPTREFKLTVPVVWREVISPAQAAGARRRSSSVSATLLFGSEG